MPNNLNRILPYNIEAEKALLGAILTNNQAYDRVQDQLRPEHFAMNEHGLIYEAIQKLIDRGRPADAVTLHRLFERMNVLEEIGGVEYLTNLLTSVVSIVNTPHYAKLIYDYWRRRELIGITEDALNAAYEENPEESASTHIESLEESLYQLSDDGSGGGDPVHIRLALEGALQMAEEARNSDGEVVGVATGLRDLDALLGGLRDTNLYILAARPALGKTALATNIAFNAAEKGPVGFFSLEMSKEQLAQRLQSEGTEIDTHNINLGRISTMDMVKLQEASAKISERQLYIDDTPAINTSQLRARARRMQRKHGIRLIVIDYLQLLEPVGMNRNDSPVSRTTAISGALKALAKELHVPVLALSQLNRAVEHRDPPKPILSDLRESGCLSVETTLLTSPGGVHYNTSSRCSVSTLNKDGEIVMADSKNLLRRPKEMVRIKLRTGRFIDCTLDHPILTDQGWTAAKDLTTTHSVALAANIPEPPGAQHIPEARWIGWMLGNGSTLGNSSPSFICSDERLAQDFIKTTEKIFKLTPRPHHHRCKAVWQYDITAGPVRTSAGNPCKNWLRENDLWGRRSYEKYIPDWFTETADNNSVAELLGGLIDTDGSVPISASKMISVKFATTSRIMAEQVLWCFLRLGIVARIDDGSPKQQKHHHTCYTVQVADGPSIEKLRKVLRLTGKKGDKLRAINCRTRGSNFGDRLGKWVGTRLLEISRSRGISQNKLGYRDQKKRISKKDLRHFLSVVGDEYTDLDWLVSQSIWWDQLKYVEPMGIGEVFDRQVDDNGHNFVANGIIVHNSIEQDADVVMFIYREAYYYARKKPEQREGETEMALMGRMADFQEKMARIENKAEIIVAKQRHGPVGSCALSFDGPTCRFGDFTSRDDYRT